MDLLVVEDSRDFIAVKKGGCMNCAINKLKCKIFKIVSIEPAEFTELKNLGVLGVIIKCQCDDFTPMDYKVDGKKTEKEKKKEYKEKSVSDVFDVSKMEDKEKEERELLEKKKKDLVDKEQERIQMNYAMDYSKHVK